MDPAVIVSVVAGVVVAIFSSITAPLILAHRTEMMHREDREADWDRQDEVARKAAEVADNLATSQQVIVSTAEAARLKAEEAARLLVVNNDLVASTSSAISGQLGVVHELVNSAMTTAMESELDARRNELAMMREVVQIRKDQGQQPTVEGLAAIDATQEKIASLEAAIADRAKAQARADAAAEHGSPLDASAARLDASADNLDGAAGSLTAAAAAHRAAQDSLDVATGKLEDKTAELEAGEP